jgi:hypothetical protein
VACASPRDAVRGLHRRALRRPPATPTEAPGLSHWSSRELAAFIRRTEGVYVSHHYVAKLWQGSQYTVGLVWARLATLTPRGQRLRAQTRGVPRVAQRSALTAGHKSRASTTTPAPQSVTASMTSEPRCGRAGMGSRALFDLHPFGGMIGSAP